MKPNFLELRKRKDFAGVAAVDTATPLRLPMSKDASARGLDQPKTTILLVTEDRRLHLELRDLANALGRIVVRVDRTAGALPVVRVVNPAAVLLDLDLPNQSSWEIADALSSEPDGPPMILFTGRTDQSNVETAIGTGAVLAKSDGPSRLLEAVDEVLGMSDSSRARWNANQVELVRWLSPCRWSGPVASTYRFRGIND
jgi:CheY-like chemotaxis protein